jgi:hypothetical protein
MSGVRRTSVSLLLVSVLNLECAAGWRSATSLIKIFHDTLGAFRLRLTGSCDHPAGEAQCQTAIISVLFGCSTQEARNLAPTYVIPAEESPH